MSSCFYSPECVEGVFSEVQYAQQGEDFSFTFDKPGTYTYHCSIHPDMTASVKSQEEAEAVGLRPRRALL